MRSMALDELVRSLSPETGSQSAYLQPSFSTIKQCLAQIDADASERLSTDGLREDGECLFTLVGSLQAIIARRLTEIDRRGQQGPPDPDESGAPWLHDSLNDTPNAAYTQARIAQDSWQASAPPHPPTSTMPDDGTFASCTSARSSCSFSCTH